MFWSWHQHNVAIGVIKFLTGAAAAHLNHTFQQLMLVDKDADGRVAMREVLPVRFSQLET
jgi:hypothetical protein